MNKQNALSAELLKTGQESFFNSNSSKVVGELWPPLTGWSPDQPAETDFSDRSLEVIQYDCPRSLNTLPILHFNKIINDDSNSNSLITPVELAKFLGISKSSVYLLVETRKLPFYKVGGSLRFKMSDIEEYLQRVRVEPIVKEIL